LLDAWVVCAVVRKIGGGDVLIGGGDVFIK
jgi:hypothetical protein